MGQIEKLIERFKTLPSDFSYDELRRMLAYFGYEEMNKGKTSGSRVAFYRAADQRTLYLHKPHPGNILPAYKMKELYRDLKERGDIK